MLLLRPGSEGTEVATAGALPDISGLLLCGMTLADAVIPKTRPAHADQLTMFADS